MPTRSSTGASFITQGDSMIRRTQTSYSRSRSQEPHALSIPARGGPRLPRFVRAPFTLNSGEPAFASRDRSIRRTFVWFWSNLAGDLAALEHEHLDCGRHYRHAARLHRTERGGPDGA